MIKEKKVYTTTEQDICSLISESFGVDFDSIVAAEELGNQVWCTVVRSPDEFDKEDVDRCVTGKQSIQFITQSFLNVLGGQGKIPFGDYEIDCTW